MGKITTTKIARFFYLFMWIAIIFGVQETAYAQEIEKPSVHITDVDASDFPLVSLSLYGENIGGNLTDYPIAIREDGIEVSIIGSQISAGGSLTAIVIDSSKNILASGNSGEARHIEIANAVTDFVGLGNLSPETDWLAIYTINNSRGGFTEIAPWQRTHQTVVSTLFQYQPQIGTESSSFSDLLNSSLKGISKSETPSHLTRSMVVFSDGSDLVGSSRTARIIQQANELDVRIHTVMLGAETDITKQNLSKFSDGTGGQYVLLERVSDLQPLWQTIRLDQVQQRVLTYRTNKSQPAIIQVALELRDGQELGHVLNFPIVELEPVQIELLEPNTDSILRREGKTLDTLLVDTEPKELPIQISFTWPDGKPRSLQKVEYSLNNETLTQQTEPFDKMIFPIESLGDGSYALEVKAVDEFGVESAVVASNINIVVERLDSTISPAVAEVSAPDASTAVQNLTVSQPVDVNNANGPESLPSALVNQGDSESTSNNAGEGVQVDAAQGENDGLEFLGVKLPKTIEIFGVTFLVNGVTLLIAAFPLIFILMLFIYWVAQKFVLRDEYDFNYYDLDEELSGNTSGIGYASGTEYGTNGTHDISTGGQTPLALPKLDMAEIEDVATAPVRYLEFHNNSPARLIYVSGGDHLPAKLPIEASSAIRIGRKRSLCDLVIDDMRISRLHATIATNNSTFYIRDEGSSGGTFVNRHVLGASDSQILNHNDIINFNEVEYRFEVMNADTNHNGLSH